MPKRQLFSSHLTTILAMIGVSVGLGNVWRFPYMMGLYGGSAFLFIYLLFTFFLAVPAVTVEWALGRISRKGPIGAFSLAFNPTAGHIIGYILLITVIIADSYYIVVIANVMTTAGFSIMVGFNPSNIEEFGVLLSDGRLQYLISLVILSISIYVIYLGLNKGIEWISKFIVPFFLILMAYLIFQALTIDGALDRLFVFLKPDFSRITSEVVFAAMGQSFFSLGLGGTFLLIYGSYMRSDQQILRGAVLTGVGDVGAALMAGIFIVPTILAFNLDLASGPTLLFETLPQLFGYMPYGRLVGSLFLIGLTLVAFLSNIAALEVVAGGLNDSRFFNFTRSQVIAGLAVVEAVLILPSALNANLIGTLDLIFGSAMQTIGSATAILAVCWGFSHKEVIGQIMPNLIGSKWGRFVFLWLKWVIPMTLFVTLIVYLYNNFRSFW